MSQPGCEECPAVRSVRVVLDELPRGASVEEKLSKAVRALEIAEEVYKGKDKPLHAEHIHGALVQLQRIAEQPGSQCSIDSEIVKRTLKK